MSVAWGWLDQFNQLLQGKVLVDECVLTLPAEKMQQVVKMGIAFHPMTQRQIPGKQTNQWFQFWQITPARGCEYEKVLLSAQSVQQSHQRGQHCGKEGGLLLLGECLERDYQGLGQDERMPAPLECLAGRARAIGGQGQWQHNTKPLLLESQLGVQFDLWSLLLLPVGIIRILDREFRQMRRLP